VQHEGDTLCRRQPIEDHQQCSADRIGEQGIFVRTRGWGHSDAFELVEVGQRPLRSPFSSP
jgi:hypothetical protein